MKLTKERIIVGVAYVVYMLIFYFIAMPKATFINHFIAAVILTGVFYVFYQFVKVIMGQDD